MYERGKIDQLNYYPELKFKHTITITCKILCVIIICQYLILFLVKKSI